MNRYLLFLITLVGFTIHGAFGKTVESVGPPNVRVFPLMDARLDFALRIEAINRAKVSIDVAVYMHTGKLGTLMNQAIQAAIGRGVKVRFVTEALTTVGPTQPFGSALAWKLSRTWATNAACLGEIICLSPYSKMMGNMSHETTARLRVAAARH